MNNIADSESRITEVKLGSGFTENLQQTLTGRDERERELIRDSLKSKLQDITRPHVNRIDANLQGPLTLTLDQTEKQMTFALKDRQGNEQNAALELRDIKGFIRGYWKSRKDFADNTLPGGEARLRNELERHDAHGHGTSAILTALGEQKIQVTRNMGEALFSMLTFAYRDPEIPNPSADISVRAGYSLKR